MRLTGIKFMTTLENVITAFEALAKEGRFDRNVSPVKIIAGGNGSITAQMKIEEKHSNRGGFLHGGMTALLVDSISSAALLTHPKCVSPGVSVSINMSYLKAVPIGEEILIKASTDRIGQNLAFLLVDIFSKKSGDLVARGTHTKFIGGSPPIKPKS